MCKKFAISHCVFEKLSLNSFNLIIILYLSQIVMLTIISFCDKLYLLGEIQKLDKSAKEIVVEQEGFVVAGSKQERWPGVELLKIIAIFLICLAHTTQTSLNILLDMPIANRIFLNFMFSFGQIGNIIFIICSSYFLQDSKKTKKEKAINILLDSCFISIIIFCGFLAGGYQFTFGQAIKQILPDLFSNVWFVPVYVLFYILHPLLNFAIDNLNKKSHLTVVVVIFLFYSFPKFFLDISANSCRVLDFVIVYFVVAYVKKYCQDFNKNVKKNLICFFVFGGLFLILSVLNNLVHICNLSSWYCPILIPALIFLFNLFNSMKFKNKVINNLSSCSLFVYCIHENILLRRNLRPVFLNLLFESTANLYLMWIVVCAILIFLVSMALSLLYKYTVHKVSFVLSKKVAGVFDKGCEWIYKKTEKGNKEVADK